MVPNYNFIVFYRLKKCEKVLIYQWFVVKSYCNVWKKVNTFFKFVYLFVDPAGLKWGHFHGNDSGKKRQKR